jgi:hypothetical protein
LINNDTANEGKQKLAAGSFNINKFDDGVKTTPNTTEKHGTIRLAHALIFKASSYASKIFARIHGA